MKIKICGITNLTDALYVEECGADAVGFVFYPKSKRYIEPEKVLDITSNLSPSISKVGVFVNESYSDINLISKNGLLNIVQIVAEEAALTGDKIKFPQIQVFRVGKDFNYSKIRDITKPIILDTYIENEPGGTGKTFDWSLIPENIRSCAIIAGGVSSENIEEIWEKIKPYGVDLSSSLESSPGKKDHAKVKDFFSIVSKLKS